VSVCSVPWHHGPVLHVTNGDSAVGCIRTAGIDEPILPWRDVLHDGPVPAGLVLPELSRVRARYLADSVDLDFEAILREFAERDAQILSAHEIALWFEHDLYDQLQLIQILDTVRDHGAKVVLICRDRYLGCLPPEEIADMWLHRAPVSDEQYAIATRAWEAFRAPDPGPLKQLVRENLSALPFLERALRRHLDDLPSPVDGLSRSERQILQAVRDGACTFSDVFTATQRMEEAIFMGDLSARRHIDRLTSARVPLLTPEPIRLTEAGARVLAGEEDNVRLNGIDRWWGGVHLSDGSVVRP
jgi:hypothetical protein